MAAEISTEIKAIPPTSKKIGLQTEVSLPTY